METTVTRNEERSRFEITTDDGTIAGFAEYVVRPGVVEFRHTEVDDAFEGHGIGSTLVRAALDEVRASGDRVVPTCPFFKSWIEKHEDYQDLVA
ncbi:GNAT family N-acetyltransferase [Nocardioides panacisoli]|uniref:GNAT family N-acetyltransferase n=1 Tax=Nocardioides panacisoli TaxID=627624 RepID=A0ABP7I0R8_9ACTN